MPDQQQEKQDLVLQRTTSAPTTPLVFEPVKVICLAPNSYQFKTVTFIRHAEATSNLAAEKYGHQSYESWEWLDAELSETGVKQAEDLQKIGTHLPADMVVVSPLTRALKTALIGLKDLYDKGVPFIVKEELRERTGLHPCDKRKTFAQLKQLFPQFDWTEAWQSDEYANSEDPFWPVDRRENLEELTLRMAAFTSWLKTRPEKHIVVVSHGGFLRNLFATFYGEFELRKKPFANCEIRTVDLIL